MTDSMKFGPEWLRNLSSEGNTGGAPKYQLAEHRYGREEMLALFDKNVRAPDPLVKLQGLYVEKTQTPMALLTMTEEENRQWNKGINSDVVLRLTGKTVVAPPGGAGGGGLRGRGASSVDRGRGRLRGSGGFHYSRGLSYEEQSDGIKEGGPPERGFTRSIRSFDRPQGVERSWVERNGGDPGDWNGSISPRKEFSMKDFSSSGRNNNTESWRRHRATSDDEEGWRKSDKWGRSNSWRDEAESGDGGGLSKSSSRTSSWGRGWADEGLRGRSHDEDSLSMKRNNFVDEVPEWAMENPSESGGSFDASGAFHGGNYSDEEEEHNGSKSAKNRLNDETDLRNKSKSPRVNKKSNRNDYDDEGDETDVSPKDRKLSRSQTAQGNLTETSKITSHSLSKSQSSSNVKTESSDSSSASSKRTEHQTFDRIRAQHQNFIDKKSSSSNAKDTSETVEVNDLPKKENAVELNSVSEEVLKSETSAVLETGVSNVKNSGFSKDNLSDAGVKTGGNRLPEEEIERAATVNRQGSEEDMERMAEVVKDTVVKLFEDEEKPPINVETDKWYYRDPQGVVQGPFRSSEMLEWFMNGYFQLSLLVRREQDELYVKLGDLMMKCGKVPFLPGVNIPVLKADAELSQQTASAPPPQAAPQPQPHTQPQPFGLPQPDLFMQQYHQQYQMLQKQFLLSQQLTLNKLSQSEMWNRLSPVQQSILMQNLALAQQPPLTIDQIAQVEKNPLSQLIAQMQQNKVQIPEVRDTKTVDPIRQLLQHMSVMPTAQPPLVTALNPTNVMLNHPLNPQAHLNSVMTNTGLNPTPSIGVEETKVEDPIQSLLRQLGNQSNIQSNIIPPPAPTPADSLWGAPGRLQHWTQPSQPVNANAGNLPLWEIKTEQQILAEQQLRLDEERRQEELRKRKEEEEEEAKRQKELEEKRREEEKREEKKRLELKRLEEEKLRLQKEKEKEEKKKAEELKKKQQQEEALKKKQEMAKKMQEAQKKKEEKERKKEEEREKKRLLEEGKKKLENEKRKKEEEQQRLKKKQEEEEAAAAAAAAAAATAVKKQEQAKRPAENAKKTPQEPQMEPLKRPLSWSQPAAATPGTNLSDIQKMQEREKKQLLREQQAAQQKELQEMQKENENRRNGLNLKWADQMPKVKPSVKSLAEIQAEEQLQMAKQLEKERLERAQQQKEAVVTSTTSIWGNASQSLTWTNSTTPWGVTPVQSNPAPGFWDAVAPNSTKTKSKTPGSPLKGKPQGTTNVKPVNNAGTNQKGSKPKSKKEEAAVMKLFERLGDEFTSWCSASLQSIQSDVDIPTFVSFLRDIESPYEVSDYVKCYLGDGKEAQEFAKQFLERRSRWMSAQKANAEDDKNPSSQYQTNVAQEFQEVKGKGKKSKKGKMLKVDSRILGFSVTAAPDRINVGDRDYVNHNL